MKQTSGFLGTYFEREVVLRLERWTRIIAWGVLAAYVSESGYNVFQSVSASIQGAYPLDWYFVFTTFSRVLQGGMLFVLLQVVAQILLILLDIEDNTRRAARANLSKE